MTIFRAGQTGLVVIVSAAEPVVGRARSSYDPSTWYGVPPHVSVLFPFLPQNAIDDGVREEVGRICASVTAFDVSFAKVRRWPSVGYLAPDTEAPFRWLTAAVAARWPDHPPYGGEFEESVPHLTVAEGDGASIAAAEALVGPGLPISTRVERVDLIGFDGARWASMAGFPLS